MILLRCILSHVVFSLFQAAARSRRDPRVCAPAEGKAAHGREFAGASTQDQGYIGSGHRCQGEQPHDRRQVLYGHAQGDAHGS